MRNKYFGIEPFGATPSERQLNHFKIGKKAFIHFGINTFSDKEWGDGKEDKNIFNPTDANVRGWIKDLKEAGFEMVILTAKHHDGFCLWPSKYTEHTIKNTPYKNGEGDIVKEFTDACHEFNVKAGIYISPWDRNSEYWGKDEYSVHYAKQLEEIVTNYGRIDEMWWDGAGSQDTWYDWGLWAYILREHQPDAVMFGGPPPYIEMRWVGNEAGFAGRTHYASIDRSAFNGCDRNLLNSGRIGAELYIPAEVDVSVRPGWFFHEDQDDMVKSSRKMDDIWFRSVGNNAIMLLNFPPDRTGNLVRKDVDNAIESHKRISNMLSTNFVWGAKVSADTQYCVDTEICKAYLKDDELFYATAGDKNCALINIALPESTPSLNTLILGEKIELGERITSFKLECLDFDEPKTLYEGTSVGYLRAVTFERGEYKNLRLTLQGITAPLTLRTLSLTSYEEDNSEEAIALRRLNLATLKTSQITISEDRKNAEILFGGIYPFDTVCFNVYWAGGDYKIYAFDGTNYYVIAEGRATDHFVHVKLDSKIDDSYQVKIEYSKPLSQEPDIKIM